MSLAGTVGLDGERFARSSTTDHVQAHAIPRYRPDIDGLRAIAVLGVVLVHSGMAGFSGGYLGVDIFFVISGYLIQRDLAKSLAEGKFSAIAFYGRRLRRTVPALYLVTGVTLVAATFVMIPGDLDEAARSLFPTIGLIPNFYFWQKTGYFDPEALTKPLLHCWSLGVEAQFYLVAPLLALGPQRLGRRARLAAFVITFVVALATAVAMRYGDWATGFYLAPGRLFEFLIGVTVAEGFVPPVKQARIAEIVAAVGLLAIGLSIVSYSRNVMHPGLPTLVPCLATAAIIHVGSTRRTIVSRLLGMPALALIGLISYSIYLWHWPVIVLTRGAGIDMTPLVLALQAALVVGLSVATWRFVEVPFRTAGSNWRRRLPWLLPVSAAALAVFAFAVICLQGLPQRFPPDVATVASYYNKKYDAFFREGRCFITSAERLEDFDRATCLRLDDKAPNVLLLGDSHAAQLYMALRDAWPNTNVLQATASGCKPILGTSGPDRCTALMEEMLQSFIPAHRLDAVVLAGLWDESDVSPLKRTLAILKPAVGKVVLFGPMPRWDMPLATLLARDMMRRNFDDVPSHLFKWIPQLDRRLSEELGARVTYVSPWQTLCGSGHCRFFTAAGVPIQFDFNHLTPAGANEMMADIRLRQPTLLEPSYRSTSSR